MTKTKIKSLRVTKDIIAQREAVREAMKAKIAVAVPGTAVLSITKSLRKIQPEYQKLFQENPDTHCMYTKFMKSVYPDYRGKNFSHANSRESQQNGAWRELEIMKRNGRIPTKHLVLRFQIQFKTKYDMTKLLTQMFRYLGDHGIVAAVALEGTRGDFDKPNNKVHCHFLIDDKDAPISNKKLISLFVKACKLRGLERGKDVKIGDPKKLSEDFTFDYFVKIGKHGVSIPLFIRGLYIRKFRCIGKWFTKSKRALWEGTENVGEGDMKKAAAEAASKPKTSTKKSTKDTD